MHMMEKKLPKSVDRCPPQQYHGKYAPYMLTHRGRGEGRREMGGRKGEMRSELTNKYLKE